jgi:hypothetical protein
MKTDRFADSIRRKLDSIRPDFSERDWTKMQAMLKQAGPLPNALPPRPRVFSGQAARLIVAGAAGTVLFLGTTLYQTYELNRLRKLTQAVSQPAPTQVDSARTITTDTPMANRTDRPTGLPGVATRDVVVPERATDIRQTSPTVIRDTVYIDRYIRVPGNAQPRTERLARTADAETDQQLTAETDLPTTPGSRPVVSDRLSSQVNPSGDERVASAPKPGISTQSTELNGKSGEQLTHVGQPNEVGTAKPKPATDEAATHTDSRSTVVTGQSALSRPDRTRSVADQASPSTRHERNRAKSNQNDNIVRNDNAGAVDSYATTGSVSVGGTNEPTNQTETYASAPDPAAGNALNRRETNGAVLIQAEPIQPQPVQLGQVAWEQRLMQRSRRMRPARTVVVGGASVAQSGKSGQPKDVSTRPEQQSQPSLVKLRVGPSGDLYGKLWSAGGFAELLVGKHVTVSVGLSRASFDNGTYLDEDDFRKVNNSLKEFRRQYPVPGASNRHEILDIRLETVRLLMPITIGYRLPIGPSIALTPTLGTNLNLKSQEQGSYIVQQRPPFPIFPPSGNGPELGKKDFCEIRNVSVFNNMTLGANIEWHKKHWGVQAGPVLSITSQPDPDWVSTLSGGVRARAFFQF